MLLVVMQIMWHFNNLNTNLINFNFFDLQDWLRSNGSVYGSVYHMINKNDATVGHDWSDNDFQQVIKRCRSLFLITSCMYSPNFIWFWRWTCTVIVVFTVAAAAKKPVQDQSCWRCGGELSERWQERMRERALLSRPFDLDSRLRVSGRAVIWYCGNVFPMVIILPQNKEEGGKKKKKRKFRLIDTRMPKCCGLNLHYNS